jgi:hypothetical protein
MKATLGRCVSRTVSWKKAVGFERNRDDAMQSPGTGWPVQAGWLWWRSPRKSQGSGVRW